MAVYKSKKPTKDGRQYFFRIKYKDILGVSHDYTSPKFKSPKEAKDEEARYRIKVGNYETNTSAITFGQAFLEYKVDKDKTIKKQTIKKDLILYSHLMYFQDKKINDINLGIYKKFVSELEKEALSTNYKNKILGLFRRVIVYSAKYYNTSESILKYVENFKEVGIIKKEMDFFTYDEYKKFDSIIEEPEWHTFFEVLYYMGLRQGETQALNWTDIDFEKGTIRINKTLTTKIKGEKYTISSPKTKSSIRTLPLAKNLLEDLKTMKNKAMQYNDYKEEWFIFGNIYPFPETTIQVKKNMCCDKAGLRRIRIHDFRHSCASLLINQGASIALVSKYLGHSNISMTLNTYTHLYKSELENISNLLNNL